MATPQEAQREIMDMLHDHFDRSAEYLTGGQIAEMTGLDIEAVHNALRILYKGGWVEGPSAAEVLYPLMVTGIRYEAA